MEREGVDKFYLSHLIYAGRGNRTAATTRSHRTTREAMDLLFERCWQHVGRRRCDKEFVTGNNDADGVYFLHWVRARFPDAAAHIRAKLAAVGRQCSGVNVANIDNLGNVHPDTFWWHYTLGNVRERPFSEIWPDRSDPIMAGLKARPRPVKGRCGACRTSTSAAATRACARMQLTGDPWAEDPACYLTDAEIGVAPRRRGAPRPIARHGACRAACLGSLVAGRSSALALAPRRAGRRAAGRSTQSTAPLPRRRPLGGTGPALLPESLARLQQAGGRQDHRRGPPRHPDAGLRRQAERRRRSQRWSSYIYTPPGRPPRWGEAEIRASRVVARPPDSAARQAACSRADPLNLFVVVESGDHHVTILDGDRFEPLAPLREPLRAARRAEVHARRPLRLSSPRATAGSASTTSGTSQVVAEVRAGLNTRNVAVSGDGRVRRGRPTTCRTRWSCSMRATCACSKSSPARDAGRQADLARVSAVYDAAPRKSFVVALKDIPEVWEIAYDPNAAPIFGGLVHGYETGMEEAIASEAQPSRSARTAARRAARRLLLRPALRQPDRRRARRRQAAGRAIWTCGARSPSCRSPGMPHLGSGITWDWQGRRVMATPHLKEGAVSIIDMKTGSPSSSIKTPGPGFFMRSHENSRYAWVDCLHEPDARTRCTIIDKRHPRNRRARCARAGQDRGARRVHARRPLRAGSACGRWTAR